MSLEGMNCKWTAVDTCIVVQNAAFRFATAKITFRTHTRSLLRTYLIGYTTHHFPTISVEPITLNHFLESTYHLFNVLDCVWPMPSVLWRCWLDGRKGIQPVKNWVVGCCHVSGSRCIWPSWCHCHSLSLAPVNPDWFYLPSFTFLAQPGSPGQNPRGP